MGSLLGVAPTFIYKCTSGVFYVIYGMRCEVMLLIKLAKYFIMQQDPHTECMP